MAKVTKSRVGVIVDNRHIARWQANALRAIADNQQFILYSCTNTRPPRRGARHAFYYLLNLWAIRNRLTRKVAIPAEIEVLEVVEFEAESEGNWQRLPASIIDRIVAAEPSAILKFGMGLLRVPPGLPAPILSYHHGDPQRFRGRPAGFYELAEGHDRMGQIVQILSNELDAGFVVASAETKVHAHSYRATLIEAFQASAQLLRPALANALSGTFLPPGRGKVYSLPSNLQVARFCLERAGQAARRLAYGAFVEKKWQVAEVPAAAGCLVAICDAFPAMDTWEIQAVPPGYRFIADPFHAPAGGGILVEGLRSSTGRGEILSLSAAGIQRLALGPGHCSYPAVIATREGDFIVPEIASWSAARLYRLDGPDPKAVLGFEVDESPRLLDPTLLEHDGGFYLFANRAEEGPGVLRLWFGASLQGRFTEHRCSPIRISPAGSRMAGNVINEGNSLLRVGQDLTRGYGDGVLLFAIERLSRADYAETARGRLKFTLVQGPHTVNIRDGRVLFDFYRDAFSPLAGFRRLRERRGQKIGARRYGIQARE